MSTVPGSKLAPVAVILAASLSACGPSVVAANPDARLLPPVDASLPVADAFVFPDVPLPADALDLGPVSVAITADNAYSFGYGDVDSITHFTQGTRAVTAGQIFNCPIGNYTVPDANAPPDAFLYIVSWDDLAVTQGVLGQFKRLTGTIYTGDPNFQVCATGLDYSGDSPIPPDAGTPTEGPTIDVINAQIAICNAGTGGSTTSMGWVNAAGPITPGATGTLAVGEDNSDAGGTFGIVCQAPTHPLGIDAAAKWMWYLPPGVTDAFHATGTNTFKAFLIFRLGVNQIIISREHDRGP